MRKPKGRRSALLFVAACAGAVAGCKEDYSDDPFGVLDLAPTFNGTTVTDPTVGVQPNILPTIGFVDGIRAEYYDFGAIPTRRDPVTNEPLSVPVQPMYFFFRQPEGFPLFSTSVREARDGTDWIRGGKDVLDPNPKDFCGPLPAAERPGKPCESQNRLEKKKPYATRFREKLVDANRHNADYQRPIIDISPADTSAYTGLWEIIEVTAPGDYQPDSIKHRATLDRAVADGKLRKRATGKVINCPIVDERTTVNLGVSDPRTPHPRIELWYRRQLAFCYLAHGWETLGNDQGQLLFSESDDQRVDTFDVARVDLTGSLGSGAAAESRLVVPIVRAYYPVIIGADQGNGLPSISQVPDSLITHTLPRHNRNDPPGYSPIHWSWQYEVPPDYVPGALKSFDALDPSAAFPEGAFSLDFKPTVKNLSLRGALVPCGYAPDPVNGQCGQRVQDPAMPDTPNATVVDGRGDPTCTKLGLDCNKDTCYCEARFVGYGEACGPGIAQCDPGADKFALQGYACFPPNGGFCYLSCDASKNNTLETQNTDKKLPETIDSRCNELPGFACHGTSFGNFCLKYCDQNVTQGNQCATTATVHDAPENIGAGQICQDLGIEVCSWPDGYNP